MEEPKTVYTPGPHGKRRKWVKLAAMLLVVLLLAVAGWLAWQLKQCKDKDKQTAAATAQLQTKVTSLTKQLAAAKGSVSAGTPTAPSTGCTPTALTQGLKDNFAAAVGSKNYAALEGYMASSVTLVIAASEKGGSESSTQAIADMDYLSSATGPWDFNLPASTTSNWAAHFYKQYFTGTFYAGKEPGGKVVSFQFDSCGKINSVFMAADAGLLE